MSVPVRNLSKYFRSFSITLLMSLSLGVASSNAVADVPDRPYDVWRTYEKGHYFLHDYVNQTWVETINCSQAFTFKLSAQKKDGIILYDGSRDLFVYLTEKRMFLWDKATKRWNFYRDGHFDPRFLYQHVDKHGGSIGYISLRPACTWAEVTTGHFFKETLVLLDQIVVYDTTRNLYAQLGDRVMALRVGPIGNFNFFRNASWQ